MIVIRSVPLDASLMTRDCNTQAGVITEQRPSPRPDMTSATHDPRTPLHA